MPRSQPKKRRDVVGRPPTGEPTSAGRAQPEPNALPDGNHNHSANHDRRRSGRVTYRPKATEMLTVHARTEDERHFL